LDFLPVPSDSLATGLLQKCLRTETPRSLFSILLTLRSVFFHSMCIVSTFERSNFSARHLQDSHGRILKYRSRLSFLSPAHRFVFSILHLRMQIFDGDIVSFVNIIPISLDLSPRARVLRDSEFGEKSGRCIDYTEIPHADRFSMSASELRHSVQEFFAPRET